MAGKFYWLKLKEDFFQTEIMEWLEEQEHGTEYVLLYVKLCLLALKADGKLVRQVGKMTIPYNEEKLAEHSRISLDVVKKALELYAKIGLIITDDDGIISLPEVSNMVGTESASKEAEKKRTQRQKKKGQNVSKQGDKMSPEEGDKEVDKLSDRDIEIRDIENRYISLLNPLSCEEKNVAELYEKKIGILTERIAEQLKDLLEEFGEKRVIRGIEIAAENKATSISYVAKCVKNPIADKNKQDLRATAEAALAKAQEAKNDAEWLGF